MKYIDKVIDNLDNVTINNNKVTVIEPHIFDSVVSEDSQNNVEYNEEQLNLEQAVDFVMFCLNKEKHYKAKKLSQFGIELSEIAQYVGFYDRSGASRAIKGYNKKRNKVEELMREYIRVNNEITNMKSEYIKKGTKEKSDKISLKEICEELGVDYNEN